MEFTHSANRGFEQIYANPKIKLGRKIERRKIGSVHLSAFDVSAPVTPLQLVRMKTLSI